MDIIREFKIIKKHYSKLIKITKNHYFIGIENEWIVDNYYLLVEQENLIKSFLLDKKTNQYTNKNIDMYKIVEDILTRYNYTMDEKILIKEIDRYQRKSGYNFLYDELRILPNIVSIIIVKKIADICHDELLKLDDKRKISNLIHKLKIATINDEKIDLDRYFKITEKTSNFSLVYFNEQLKELGKFSNIVFKQLDSLLSNKEMSLKSIINKEHYEKANVSIVLANAFNSIEKVNIISIENLYNKLSYVEKILKQDKFYQKMSQDTKNIYRNKIIEKAKKSKQNINLYTESILDKNDSITEYLFSDKRKSVRSVIYITLIIGFVVFLTYVLSFFYISNMALGMLLLMIPVSEVVIYYLNRAFMSLYSSKPLPRLDFSEGIPNDCKTMVVTPTIIKDTKKIDMVFKNLESFYLACKKSNIYFALLGDCKEQDKEFYELDEEISEHGKKVVEQLNQKYKKEIFYFAYRKRKYNKGENSWLGFERKRGALLEFNDLLLGNLSNEEQKERYHINTFQNFKRKIKYVITLDVDTKLLLNNAVELIGIMAHPLNKPILNTKKNKIIRGYGILQPRVSVDVDSTNTSLFSQIYAGIGGLDQYNNLFPNFYQDVFNEGCFTGKGIYDLEIFQQVLKNRFPNNLILSHDLLEGNYLNCGAAVDVELIDDFPSKFLIDASRRSRWARGDIQIVKWLFPKVRNTKNQKVANPISLLGKWKIFDNIRRGLLDFSLITMIVFSFILGKNNPIWWILFTLFILLLPAFSYLREQFSFSAIKNKSFKYYNILSFGTKAIFLRVLSVFSSIPFNAYLYITSFIKALYRMYFSKKRLLNWMTAEDAEKIVNSSLKNTIKQFWPNYLVSILLIAISIINGSYIILSIFLSLILVSGPFVAYLISLNIIPEKDKIKKEDEEYLKDIAYKTWKFFEDNLTLENHYLITDNYQLNRDIKVENRTSPTNIAMSLISVISAYELGFIDDRKAFELIKKIIFTIKKLTKWNGHLYNWYNIKTLEVLAPNFVSSVDSGNFVSALIVVKEFLLKLSMNELAKDVELLIKNTKFKELLNERNVFSVGYNADEGRLENYNYNKFMSESRLISYVAIARGEIEYKNWFNLDRTLVAYKRSKGIASWGGTTFEYFMPLLFLKSYPNTLLDESYYFTYFTHKEYMKQIDSKLPWGITESAYNELDEGQNYKYRSFGIPYLKLKDENPSKIVVAPYGSILAITEFPREIIDNIKKYEKLNMLGQYGFYESYDVTDKTPVFSYYSHHQGMILGSIANCIKDGVIQNYFMSDTYNKVYNILNKEKVQIKPVINFKMMKYKKYTYDKEQFVNDIRVFRHISTLPELSVLSNSKYSVVINDRGSGYSKYHTLRINRYRKVTEQDYGMFLYIKDLDNSNVWSNTYSPMNVLPKKYEVVFALDRIKYIRKDASIITTTEIVVAKKYNAEIRKVTFQNTSNKPKLLELTTYTEPLLCNNDDDIAHRSFNNMFVKTEYDNDTNSIIVSRKLRENNAYHYMVSKLLIENPKSEYQYETNRANFIGRNRTGKNPIALEKKLTNYVETPLDPIVSIRNTIEVDKNSKTTVYMINGFGKSREQVMDIVNTFSNKQTITEQGFEVATIMSNVTNKMTNITGNDMRLYNILLNYLLQTSNISITEKRKETLEKNILGPQNLWKFGVSGDRPVILLDVKDVDDLSLIKELLHAFEYYKSKSIFVDLVIINCDKKHDADIISKEIDDERYRMHALNSFYNTPGNIYTIDRNIISEDELNLFNTIARFSIDSSIYHTLQEYINELQRLNTVDRNERPVSDKILPVPYNKKEIQFFNEFGGFKKDGKEYTIVDQDTPFAWTNVLANKDFGTITTNNNCGFTYAINSREFKLTSWTNDNLLLDYSETIKINDENINFGITNFGFGYTESIGRIKKLDVSLVQFVAVDDMKKIYKIKIKNNNPRKQRIVLKYWFNPILGVSEEKTGRHILSKFYKDDNYLMLKNMYNQGFNDIKTYVTCTSKISDANINTILYKEVETIFYIDSHEEKEVAFILGCTTGDIKESISTHKSINKINEELENVQKNWKNKLEIINVETPDESFNYMINGWYLYQTIASRLYARASFNQVGGAYGFRDQLQDSMNICTVLPNITKAQILKNANHQFIEGDVLHWWHEKINFGLRSLYKDDYLWLIYAISEYLSITKDFSILDEKVGYVEGPTLKEDEKEKAFNFSYSNYTDTLYHHCELIINKAMNDLGENGLPLMGGGDWNDGMNRVGINGKGTSVWLGFFLYQMIEKFVSFTNGYNSKIDVSKYLKFNIKLKDSLLNVAWDQEHYLRAFFDNGNKLGSNENSECSIDLISQSMAILSEIATEKQIKSIINSIEEKLIDKENKIIKLLSPAFENSQDDPGYIMNYPKGIRENGGQYTHAVSWYIMALLKLGQYDKAYGYYQMINPINKTKTKEDVLKYKVEPYVIAADIYSNKDYQGQGGWTWYTGSSGWFYKVGIVDILGFEKHGDKLYINPKVPKEWENYVIKYNYLKTNYIILVNLSQKEDSIFVDDVKISDEYITLVDDNKNHKIVVNIGGKK